MTANTESLPLFLGSVIALSASGVMMPGPVTAVTITKGTQRKWAGALVAIGHGIIEIPLMLLVYYGLAEYLKMDGVKIGVGLAGGLLLLWMAWGAFHTKPTALEVKRDTPHGSIVAGLATTAASPYFFVWWATVGAALLASATTFGTTGIIAFAAVHWSFDLVWLLLLSWVIFKSKRLWTQKVTSVIFGICAALLAGFGVYFIYSGISLAISA
jgi:threonine/homoserine/homoserine lactone efflux protein